MWDQSSTHRSQVLTRGQPLGLHDRLRSKINIKIWMNRLYALDIFKYLLAPHQQKITNSREGGVTNLHAKQSLSEIWTGSDFTCLSATLTLSGFFKLPLRETMHACDGAMKSLRSPIRSAGENFSDISEKWSIILWFTNYYTNHLLSVASLINCQFF